MKNVLQLIELRQREIAGHDLLKQMKNAELLPERRLSFAPKMLYFLMGFKDILAQIYRNNPKTTLDKMVNAYCEEDGHHWLWYLSDLEKLGHGICVWGDNIPEMCKTIWSPSLKANRDLIFSFLYHSRRDPSAETALALIGVLEATGIEFLKASLTAAEAMKMVNELQYFGKTHYEEELGHSVQPVDLESIRVEESRRESASQAVNETFDLFAKAFDCWLHG